MKSRVRFSSEFDFGPHINLTNDIQSETSCGFTKPKNLTQYFLGFDGMYVLPGILPR